MPADHDHPNGTRNGAATRFGAAEPSSKRLIALIQGRIEIAMTHLHHLRHHRTRRSLLAGGVVIALCVLNGVTPAHAAVNCVGSIGVTQTETTVTGTAGNDTIDCGGANPGKTVNGNGGNDTITGTAFADVINGGDGNDTMTGAIGDDALNGGLGDDTMTGSAGNDTLNGGVGNDTLNGGTGTDILSGDAGNDSLTGPPNDQSVDDVNGGADTDVCQGPGTDRDVLVACNP